MTVLYAAIAFASASVASIAWAGAWLTNKMHDRVDAQDALQPPDPAMRLLRERLHCVLCGQHTPHWGIERERLWTSLTCAVCRGVLTEKHVRAYR